MIRFLVLAALLVATASCKFGNHEVEVAYKEVEMNEAPKDQMVPSALWEELEGAKSDPTQSLRFLPLSVLLAEKSPGVLGNQNLKIQMGRGGGELDLARLTKPDKGTFIFGVKLDTEEPLDELKVYFVSRAKKRSFDGQNLGAGCSSFVDITEFYKKTLSTSGLEVNTYRKRHVTLMGGAFIFSLKKPGYHFLSQVSFVDSDSESLFCTPLLAAE